MVTKTEETMPPRAGGPRCCVASDKSAGNGIGAGVAGSSSEDLDLAATNAFVGHEVAHWSALAKAVGLTIQ
jgi:hypothetical protein